MSFICADATEYIADYLPQLRQKNHLSQVDLAAALGVSSTQVCRWEAGETTPRGDSIYAICAVFDIPPNELLGWE